MIITAHPMDQTTIIGSDVNFTCEATGSPPISYKWLYNDNELVDDPGHIMGSSTSTVIIANVNVTDWGIYSCEAANIVNNVISNESMLSGEYTVHVRMHLMLAYFNVHTSLLCIM